MGGGCVMASLVPALTQVVPAGGQVGRQDGGALGSRSRKKWSGVVSDGRAATSRQRRCGRPAHEQALLAWAQQRATEQSRLQGQTPGLVRLPGPALPLVVPLALPWPAPPACPTHLGANPPCKGSRRRRGTWGTGHSCRRPPGSPCCTAGSRQHLQEAAMGNGKDDRWMCRGRVMEVGHQQLGDCDSLSNTALLRRQQCQTIH